jgi:S1-C subfamily serine protease
LDQRYLNPQPWGQPPVNPQPWLQPPVNPSVQPPVRLGFIGHFDWQQGMVVDYVTPGSIAQQVGLESGDAIVQINGLWINSNNAYFSALQASGGQGTMLVRDVRTGSRVYVPLSPYGGVAPSPFGGVGPYTAGVVQQ